jgi:hypothetical protein
LAKAQRDLWPLKYGCSTLSCPRRIDVVLAEPL